MKQFKRKLVLISLLSLSVSGQVFASGAKLPDAATTEPTMTEPAKTEQAKTEPAKTEPATTDGPAQTIPSPTSPTTTAPPPAQPAGGGAYVDQIKQIAANSSCSNYSWKNRGRAPSGYIKGMALTYARSLCRAKASASVGLLLSAASTGNTAKDALAHYASTFAKIPIGITTQSGETLRALYTLGLGLGMRESSGVYCEGWDRSAGSSRPSSAGEAGVFQTSYDSIGVHPELTKLYTEYKNTKATRCMLDVYKVGASCSSLSNLGTGAGADFQSFLKACPAFAAEYAMVTLRVLRSHYGPINRKEAEVIPACNNMLKEVQNLIDNDPYACEDLK
jgi:hypothetical protein